MSTALKFWKPGTSAPGSSLDRASEQEGSLVQSAPISSSLSVQGQRERLPIFRHREYLKRFVELSSNFSNLFRIESPLLR